jgi:predicted HTH transcriptional regulator
MTGEQLSLFGYNRDHAATWSPRELWLKLDPLNISNFLEDRRIERKSAQQLHFDELARYASMWSNTVEGGIILIGVSDNGTIGGCAHLSQDQLNRLESFHSQLCPDSAPESRRIPLTINDRPNFVEALYFPYRGFLVETNRQEAFIRRGDTCHRMTPEERDDFRSTRHERSWEQRQAGAYTYPNEFDQTILREFCDNFREREGKPLWTDEEVLVDRRLAVVEAGKLVPLNCMVLFAAKDPRTVSPGCRVRIQRFDAVAEGAGSTFRPLQDFYIEGNIPTIIARASQRISDLLYNVTWLNKDGKFVTTPEYPRWAWFEAVVNALVHRSYSFSGSEVTVKFFSDRLEIESPGGFVPPVNVSNVYFHRASRSPHLMEALRYLGFVQMTREGTRRMRESMERYNLPEPTFSQETMHGVAVRVTLRNEHQNRKRATDRDVAAYCGVDLWKQLQEHEIQIIGYTFNNKTIQVAEAAKITGRQWNTAKKDLDKLVNKGLLGFSPPKFARDPKAHYFILTPGGDGDEASF